MRTEDEGGNTLNVVNTGNTMLPTGQIIGLGVCTIPACSYNSLIVYVRIRSVLTGRVCQVAKVCTNSFESKQKFQSG